MLTRKLEIYYVYKLTTDGTNNFVMRPKKYMFYISPKNIIFPVLKTENLFLTLPEAWGKVECVGKQMVEENILTDMRGSNRKK